MTLRTVISGYRTACHSISRSWGIHPVHALCRLAATRLRFGVGPFNYCLFSLDGKAPSDWRAYLTNTDLEPVQRLWNPKSRHALVRDKLKFHARCMQAGLPTPALIGVIAAPEVKLQDVHLIASSAALHTTLQSCDVGSFFFKHGGGAHGHGAFAVLRRGAEYEFAGRVGGADALFQHASLSLPRDEMYLIQPRLSNESALSRIMSTNGLGTVRAVTLLREGRCSILSACLRITVGQNVTDNFSVGSAGNLTAPIDASTGRLGIAVGSRSRNWPDMHTVAHHPDTGVRFEGFALPYWDDTTNLVMKAHQAFPELGVIGWDVAITKEGPVLIEANHAWDINLLQVAHRRGFRAEMRAALGGVR